MPSARSPRCSAGATTGTPCFMGDGECSPRCATLAVELGLADVRRVHGLGRARHRRPRALDLRRLPRARPEEPAQRRLVDDQDLRVHGDGPRRWSPTTCASRASAPATPPCSRPPTTSTTSPAKIDELLDDPERRARDGRGRPRARRGGARLGAPGALAAARLRACARHRDRARRPEGTRRLRRCWTHEHARRLCRVRPAEPVAGASLFSRDVGAVVLGGDYQGLGIVRSLGRHGVPVVRRRRRALDRALLALLRRSFGAGRRPARREADRRRSARASRAGAGSTAGCSTRRATRRSPAFARNRERAERGLPRPDAAWETIRWAWDKRNTDALAEELGIPTPRTLAARRPLDDLDADRRRAAVGDQAGDQGALLLRHEGEGLARRQPRGAADALRARVRRSSARAR